MQYLFYCDFACVLCYWYKNFAKVYAYICFLCQRVSQWEWAHFHDYLRCTGHSKRLTTHEAGMRTLRVLRLRVKYRRNYWPQNRNQSPSGLRQGFPRHHVDFSSPFFFMHLTVVAVPMSCLRPNQWKWHSTKKVCHALGDFLTIL